MKNINNSTLWDVKPIKLSILVPTRDTVHSHFSYCLAQLYKTTSDVGIDVSLFKYNINKSKGSIGEYRHRI